MMTTEIVQSAEVKMDSPPKKSEFKKFIRIFLDRKVVLFSSILLFLMTLMAIFAPIIAPYDPYEQNLIESLKGPSSEHILGTDAFGRDTLSRIIYGARVSLIVGFVSVFGAAIIGSILGLVSGYFGGIIDVILSRLNDALLAFPPLMLALAVAAALGSGTTTVVMALLIGLIPTYARLMRGQVLSVKESDYIKAAEVIGASNLRILFKHIFPNCLSPIIVLITLNLGVAILSEAALSFLGLGIAPPTASWGSMVNEGYRYLVSNPELSIAPGVCVMVIVLAFNIVGDGLRDALDPRLRGTK
jgi:peptide/nickel transport system permease protein